MIWLVTTFFFSGSTTVLANSIKNILFNFSSMLDYHRFMLLGNVLINYLACSFIRLSIYFWIYHDERGVTGRKSPLGENTHHTLMFVISTTHELVVFLLDCTQSFCASKVHFLVYS